MAAEDKIEQPSTTLEIIRGPDERLARVADPVQFGLDLSSFAAAMFKTMMREGGIGLAAPQVGLPLRVVVGNVPDAGGGWRFALINPEITHRSATTRIWTERCLSWPGREVRVRRREYVKVRGFNLRWRPVKFKAEGLLAACLQHEIEHLDGRNIVDYEP